MKSVKAGGPIFAKALWQREPDARFDRRFRLIGIQPANESFLIFSMDIGFFSMDS